MTGRFSCLPKDSWATQHALVEMGKAVLTLVRAGLEGLKNCGFLKDFIWRCETVSGNKSCQCKYSVLNGFKESWSWKIKDRMQSLSQHHNACNSWTGQNILPTQSDVLHSTLALCVSLGLYSGKDDLWTPLPHRRLCPASWAVEFSLLVEFRPLTGFLEPEPFRLHNSAFRFLSWKWNLESDNQP